ncbi:hypothetical protein ACFLXH_05105 [Chloroflexota bacterium]
MDGLKESLKELRRKSRQIADEESLNDTALGKQGGRPTRLARRELAKLFRVAKIGVKQ